MNSNISQDTSPNIPPNTSLNKLENQDSLEKRTNVGYDDLRAILHDMGKPMNPLVGYAEILAEELPEGEYKSYAQNLLANSKYMVFLLNELRDGVNVSADVLEPRISKVNLNEILDEAGTYVEASNLMSKSRKPVKLIKTYLSGNPEVYTDKIKLMRIFYNIASNANEFTEDLIELGFIEGPVDNTDGHLKTYSGFVRDNGNGMSEDVQAKLRKEEYLLKRNPNRVHSEGIGLRKSKELAIILGGEMGFNSMLGSGTTFWFTFKDMFKEYKDVLGETYKKEQ